MKEQIFILNNQNQLIELNESEFVTEDQFQSLLENYPKLMSGSQINPENPRKWILIQREIGIPAQQNGSNVWSLDHLFIDQDGIPTLVEVKRSSDSRIRREVVGQMLDYAANSVRYWNISDIKELFEKNCEKDSVDPEIKLSELLEVDHDSERFWNAVETNLQAGKIRLLFVADKIPKELRRIIEFLNEQMSPAEVLGVEIKQFASPQMKTLVPRVIGKTSNAEFKKGTREFNQWTNETFFEELKNRNGDKIALAIKKLIQHLKQKKIRLWYGQGKRVGSIVSVLDFEEFKNQLFAIFTYGKIEIYFQYLKEKPPFNSEEKRSILLKKLNAINGINLPLEKIDKRPSFDIKAIISDIEFNEFISVVDWLIDQIYESQSAGGG